MRRHVHHVSVQQQGPNEPRSEKTGLRGFPTRSHTNRPVQSQKMNRGLKFRIWVVEGLYYPYSENKGADQLRSLHMQKAGFLITRLK